MPRQREFKPGRLKGIRKAAGAEDPGAYPFSIPAIAAFDELEIGPGATFFVGENGSGKSTLVEAVAVLAERFRRKRF